MVTAMSKEIDFHFKGSEADAHLLPVEYIINLLEGIRDLAYLTVAQQTGCSQRAFSSIRQSRTA